MKFILLIFLLEAYMQGDWTFPQEKVHVVLFHVNQDFSTSSTQHCQSPVPCFYIWGRLSSSQCCSWQQESWGGFQNKRRKISLIYLCIEHAPLALCIMWFLVSKETTVMVSTYSPIMNCGIFFVLRGFFKDINLK